MNNKKRKKNIVDDLRRDLQLGSNSRSGERGEREETINQEDTGDELKKRLVVPLPSNDSIM